MKESEKIKLEQEKLIRSLNNEIDILKNGINLNDPQTLEQLADTYNKLKESLLKSSTYSDNSNKNNNNFQNIKRKKKKLKKIKIKLKLKRKKEKNLMRLKKTIKKKPKKKRKKKLLLKLLGLKV